MNTFLVTSLTILPAGCPDVFVRWVPHTAAQHINIQPLANQSGGLPPTQASHRTKLFRFMRLFLSSVRFLTRITSALLSGASPNWRTPMHMSKDGSIWQLFVLCLLALGGNVPQVLCFTIVWDTPEKEKLPNGLLPPPAFRGFYLDRGTKKLSKLG